MLEQRRIRWADVVQMLYKCFLFTREFVDLSRKPVDIFTHETNEILRCVFQVYPDCDYRVR